MRATRWSISCVDDVYREEFQGQCVAARVLRMVCEHEVVAIDGTVVPLNADSVCVHGDSPSAVAMARAVRARLESEGVAIRAFAGDAAASAARD